MREYCEQMIDSKQSLPPSKITYSQLMVQTFSKYPPQMLTSQQVSREETPSEDTERPVRRMLSKKLSNKIYQH